MSITAEGTACGAMRALDLPEMEAPHPGVSSGGVEVEGVFAKFAGKRIGAEGAGSCMTSCMVTCQLSRLSMSLPSRSRSSKKSTSPAILVQ